MEGYLAGDESEGSVVDLLEDSSSREASEQQQQQQPHLEGGELLAPPQQQPRAANAAGETEEDVQTPVIPPVSNLLDKLGALEKRWTDQASTTQRNKQQRQGWHASPLPYVSHLATTPAAAAAAAAAISSSPGFVDDSVSPLTVYRDSPMAQAAGAGGMPMLDDQSLSTYGSLGSPRNIPTTPSIIQTRQQAKQSTTTKSSFFERMHRGEKRQITTVASTKLQQPGRVFSFASPPRHPKLPRRPVTSVPKQRPAPAIKQSSLRSLASSSAAASSTGSNISVFDRLYRKERRDTKIWTDPGVKEHTTFEFLPSDGASKTKMVSVRKFVGGCGVSRKLQFTGLLDGPTSSQQAKMIQTAWRGHHAQSVLVGKLLEPNFVVTCELSSVGGCCSNRILSLKHQLMARATALQQIDASQLEREIDMHQMDRVSLSHTGHVSFAAWDDEHCIIQQNYTVVVECEARIVQATRSWSQEKIGATLFHNILEASYCRCANKLVQKAATLLQQWFFYVMYRNRKVKSAILSSPTLSTASDQSMKKRLERFNSLSRLHMRLRQETQAAKLETLDFAAVVLQRNFRKLLARRYCQALRDVQDLRDIVSRRSPEDNVVQGAVTRIQLCYRRYMSDKRWGETLVVRLQAHQRRRIHQHRFERLMGGVLRIQSSWRGYTTRRQLTNKYAKLSAQTLEAAWRQRFCQREGLVASVKTIQSIVRMYQSRLRYLNFLMAINRFQAVWRARQQGKSTTTALVLSAWQQRHERQFDQDALVRIQALFRMRAAVTSYQQRRDVIILLQALVRRRIEHLHHRQLLYSVVVLQSIWRSFRVRHGSYAAIFAATTIHCSWNQRKTAAANRERSAVIKIQSIARMSATKLAYRISLQRVVKLQTWGRLHFHRTKFQQLRFSCEKIQALARAVMVRSEMKFVITLVKSIQRAWHAHQRRHTLVRSVVRIQSFARVNFASQHRKELLTEREEQMCTRIQSWWRMCVYKTAHLMLWQSTLRLQCWFRLNRLNTQPFTRLKRSSAIRIQSWWRMVVTQRNYRQLVQCASILSPTTVSHMASKMQKSLHVWGSSPIKQRLNFRAESAITIQHWWQRERSRLLLKRRFRVFKLHLSRSTSRIQLVYRRYKFRQAKGAAVLLQSCWRTYRCQSEYQVLQSAIVTIQTFYRAHLARQRLTHCRNGANIVRRVWKSYRQKMQILEANYQASCATKLQAWMRRLLVRLEWAKLLYATAIAQKHWRASIARNNFQQSVLAARAVQRFARAVVFPTISERKAAITLQSFWRTCRAKKIYRRSRKMAITIQSTARMFFSRDEFLERKAGAISMQSLWRQYFSFKKYRTEKQAVFEVQKAWRARRRRTHKINMAIKIQSCVRRRRAEKVLYLQLVSVRLLQSWCRSRLCTLRFLRARRAVQLIQTVFRHHQEKRAATVIQFVWKFLCTRRKRLQATLVIQKRWRAYVQFTINKEIEGNIMATKIQTQVRGARARALRHKRMAAVILLQIFWLGMTSDDLGVRLRGSLVICESVERRRRIRQIRLEQAAAVEIQRTWRRVFNQRIYLGMRQAALVVQSVSRMYRPRYAFLTLCKASVIIQSYSRMSIAHRELQLVRQAVIVLQCFWRFLLERRRLSCVKIQGLFRGGLVRMRISGVNDCALLVQRAWRAASKRVHLKEESSAIRIQALYRMFPCRQAYMGLQTSALRLQSITRSHTARVWFANYKAAVILVQQGWRLNRLRTIELQRRQTLASTKIQAQCRGRLTRQQLQHISLCARTIQRSHRGGIARIYFKKASMAVPTIQTFARSVIARRELERVAIIKMQSLLRALHKKIAYQRLHHGVICLQAWRRMKPIRSEYIASVSSIIKIQRLFRGYVDRACLAEVRRDQEVAVIKLQTWYRSVCCRNEFSVVHSSAVLVQSVIRRALVLRLVSNWEVAARKIQYVYAKVKDHLPHHKTKHAAIVLQRSTRALIDRTNRSTLAMCSTMIPERTLKKFSSKTSGRVWGSRIRALLQDRICMAIVIEIWWRSVSQRSKFLRLRSSALQIQIWTRKTFLPKLRVERAATIRIQACFRSFLAQTNFMVLAACSSAISVLTREKMAQKIQGGFVFGSRVRKYLHQRSLSALSVQQCWRVYSAHRILRDRKQAVVILQKAAVKLFLPFARRRVTACVRLQSHWRMLMVRKSFSNFYRAILLFQAVAKRTSLQAGALAREEAARVLQKSWRGVNRRRAFLRTRRSVIIVQRQLQTEFLPNAKLRSRSAIKIQALWKARVAQDNYARLRACTQLLSPKTIKKMALKIQNPTWGSRVKRQLYVRSKASTAIATSWRKISVRSEYRKQKQAASTLQRVWRQKLPILCQRRLSATTLQACCKMFLAKRLHRKHREMTTKLQSLWRKHVAVTLYQRQKAATILLQSRYKMLVASQLFEKQRSSSFVLQSVLQMHLTRRKFKQQKMASIILQSFWRMLATRHLLLEQHAASRTLQNLWRMWVARRVFQHQKPAVIHLQSKWRMYSQRTSLRRKKMACIRVQMQWRVHVAKKVLHGLHTMESNRIRLELLHAEQIKRATIVIQSLWRGFVCQRSYIDQKLAAVLIAGSWRKLTAKKLAKTFQAVRITRMRLATIQDEQNHRAALTIQSWWRKNDCQRSLLDLKRAVVALQCFLRVIAARNLLSKYRALEVTRIQLEEIRFEQISRAARLIQTIWRKFFCARSYLEQKNAAVVLQTNWRYVSAKKILQVLADTKSSLCAIQSSQLNRAACFIQQSWRRSVCVQSYVQEKKAVIALQSSWRRVSIEKEYVKRRKAAIRIQMFYRWHMQRYSSAVLLQSRIRSYLGRRWLIRHRESVVLIQSCIRSHTERRKFLRFQKRVTLIQSLHRRQMAKMVLRKEKSAVLVLQNNWRIVLSKKALASQRDLEAKRIQLVSFQSEQKLRAALAIQEAVRGYSFAKFHIMYKENKASTKIQSQWRRCLDQRGFIFITMSVLAVQSAIRMYHSQRAYKEKKASIVCLQSQWRSYVARKNLLATISMVTYVQRQSRMRSSQFYLRRCVNAAKTIQTWLRMVTCARRYQIVQSTTTVLQSRARIAQAILLQTHTRRFIQVQKYRSIHYAALRLQGCWRSQQAEKQWQNKLAANLLMEKSASVIQSLCRTWQQRATFLACRVCSTLIQAVFRCHVQRREYSRIRAAVVTMQTASRAFLSRKSVSFLELEAHARRRRSAADMLQSIFRMYRQTKKYRAVLIGVKGIQRKWRRSIFERGTQGHVSRKKLAAAATIIQASCRKLLCRLAYFHAIQLSSLKLQSESACYLQSIWRMTTQTKKYDMRRTCAVLIQANYRRHDQVQVYMRVLRAMVTVESFARRVAAVKRVQAIRAATLVNSKKQADGAQKREQQLYLAITLQRIFRGINTRAELRKVALKTKARRAASDIQRLFRGHFSRGQSQQAILEATAQQLVVLKAVVAIQSQWRRFIIDKRIGKERLKSATALVSTLKCLTEDRHISDVKSMVLFTFLTAKISPAIHNNDNLMASALLLLQGWFKMQLASVAFQRKRMAAQIIQRNLVAYRLGEWFLDLESTVIFIKRLPSFDTLIAFQKINQVLKLSTVKRFSQESCEDWKTMIATCENLAAKLLQRGLQTLIVRKRAFDYWKTGEQAPHGYTSWVLMMGPFLEFKTKRASAITVQCLIRKYQATMMATTLRNAVLKATLIQAAARRHFAEKFVNVLRSEWTQLHDLRNRNAAVRIQSWIRMCREKRALDLRREQQRTMEAMYYGTAREKSQMEVEYLLTTTDLATSRFSGICLKRLAQRVVLGRRTLEQIVNQDSEAENTLKITRANLSKREAATGVENVVPSGP